MATKNGAKPNRVSKAKAGEEYGWTGLETFGGHVEEDILWQLRGVQRQRTYQEMSENDAIVGAMLYAIEILIRPLSWTVEPGGESPEDLKAAELLETTLTDMSHTMADFLSEWMATPVYGFAPFEICWKTRNGPNREPGKASRYSDGMIGVRKLAIRHPTTRDRWVFDESGGVQAFIQFAQAGRASIEIPIEKLLLFRCGMRKGNPEGQSLLRRSYVAWYRRKRIETIEAIGIERDLAGLPCIYHPVEWLAEGRYATLLTNAKNVVRNIKNDEQAGVTLPSIFDANGNQLLKLELLSTAGSRNFDTDKVIQRLSREMLMTALADVIVLGHEKVGSYALASSKTNLFASGIGAMADDIESVLNRHLVPRMLALNGMRVDTPPQYRHGDIEQIDLNELADYIQKLSMAGFPLFPTESGELERELLRYANLPPDELGMRLADPEPDEPEVETDPEAEAMAEEMEGDA